MGTQKIGQPAQKVQLHNYLLRAAFLVVRYLRACKRAAVVARRSREARGGRTSCSHMRCTRWLTSISTPRLSASKSVRKHTSS